MRQVMHQALRFAMVGVVNTALGLLTIYALMYFLAAPPLAANLIGYAVGLIVGYALNRAWTFSGGARRLGTTAGRYGAVAAMCYVLNFAIVAVATRDLDVNPYLAQLLGIGAYSCTLFVACKLYVFA